MVESRKLQALTSQAVPAVVGHTEKNNAAAEVTSSSVADGSVAMPTALNETSVDCSGPVEISIDETYQIAGVGFVAAGTVVSGTIHLYDTLMLGPDLNGAFVKCTVRSMESMHVPIQRAVAGQTVAFAIRAVNKKNLVSRDMFRKGMVLISSQKQIDDCVSFDFEARVSIFHHQTTIATGYQPVINCRTVKQTAAIINIRKKNGEAIIRTGDRALIHFRFTRCAEFMRVGTRFIFRDGRAKGIGKIMRILPSFQSPGDAKDLANKVSLSRIFPFKFRYSH
jgi:GTPase